jgi:hypothetical protein
MLCATALCLLKLYLILGSKGLIVQTADLEWYRKRITLSFYCDDQKANNNIEMLAT